MYQQQIHEKLSREVVDIPLASSVSSPGQWSKSREEEVISLRQVDANKSGLKGQSQEIDKC